MPLSLDTSRPPDPKHEIHKGTFKGVNRNSDKVVSKGAFNKLATDRELFEYHH
ncbi:hypothetical protein BGZ91_003158, partial [Linnemannia elongata]